MAQTKCSVGVHHQAFRMSELKEPQGSSFLNHSLELLQGNSLTSYGRALRGQDSKDLLPVLTFLPRPLPTSWSLKAAQAFFGSNHRPSYTKFNASRPNTRPTSQPSWALAWATTAPPTVGSSFGVRSEEDQRALCATTVPSPSQCWVPWLSTHPEHLGEPVLPVFTGPRLVWCNVGQVISPKFSVIIHMCGWHTRRGWGAINPGRGDGAQWLRECFALAQRPGEKIPAVSSGPGSCAALQDTLSRRCPVASRDAPWGWNPRGERDMCVHVSCITVCVQNRAG